MANPGAAIQSFSGGFTVDPNKPLRQQADEIEIGAQEQLLAQEQTALQTAESTFERDHSLASRLADTWLPFSNSATADRLKLVAPLERAVNIRRATITRMREIAPHDIPPPLTDCIPSPERARAHAADLAKQIYGEEAKRYDDGKVIRPTSPQVWTEQPMIAPLPLSPFPGITLPSHGLITDQ